jgi:hypothetical protein
MLDCLPLVTSTAVITIVGYCAVIAGSVNGFLGDGLLDSGDVTQDMV